jgi:ABC-type nitrate/sulfonate/bicarbonate transport system substrate-binding protein
MFARKILIVVLALAFVGCTKAATLTPQAQIEVVKTVVVEKVITPTPAPQVKLTKIQIPLGWLNNDEFVALQVAQEKGFFARQGLDVNLISGGGSTGFDPIIAIGGFDENVRISVPAALSLVLKAYAEGMDVVAVMALTQKEPSGFLTIVKENRQATSPCDFKGKVVSMQTESTWYVDALATTCSKGPLKSGVDFTVIPAGWTPDCLLSDECDYYCAWYTNQPYALALQGMKEGNEVGNYQMFLTSDFLPFYFGDVIVTTHAYLKEHPDRVKAFVTASVEGLQFTLDHPEEAINIASRVPGVDPKHAQWRIPVQNELVVSPDTEKCGLGYMNPVLVQEMIDFLFKNGQIAKSFSATEVVDNSFISACK